MPRCCGLTRTRLVLSVPTTLKRRKSEAEGLDEFWENMGRSGSPFSSVNGGVS